MSASTGTDASTKITGAKPPSNESKKGSTELLNGETVSKPTRPPPPSGAQLSKHRRPPPPPVRAMTLTGLPKAAEIARARAKARGSSLTKTAESKFDSVRHLVSPPPIEERENVFSFERNQRQHRAKSFSPDRDDDKDGVLAAVDKVRERRIVSPDSESCSLPRPFERNQRQHRAKSFSPDREDDKHSVLAAVDKVRERRSVSPDLKSRSLPKPVEQTQRQHRAKSFSPDREDDKHGVLAAADKVRKRRSVSPDSASRNLLKPVEEPALKSASKKPAPKADTAQSRSDKDSGELSGQPDNSKAGAASAQVVPSPPAMQPPKRPRRPYAPPIFEAKVARRRPPPVPHVIDIRDSSPQMIKAGKSPPTPKTTIVDTRSPGESPRRPPLPAALAQSSLKKTTTNKDNSSSAVHPTSDDSKAPDQATKPETTLTPTKSAPVVRFASPPPRTVSSPTKSPPPAYENSVSEKNVPQTQTKGTPSRSVPTVQFKLEVKSHSLDTPTSVAATTATPTPSHLNLTQPDSESGPSLGSPVDEDEPGSMGMILASGKSPSPSRSRRFIKSMKSSFRNIKRKRGNDGERRGNANVCQRSGSLPTTRLEGAASPEGQQQEQLGRAHTVYVGRRHSSDVYDKDKYPDELPQGMIDPVIVKAIAYLNKEQVLLEEGLFRIPGDLTAIKSLRARFNNREDVDLNEVLDPHTVAGLLKVHFREMRVSIIPRGHILGEIVKAVQSHDVQLFATVIATIEPHHLATIRMLSEVLSKIAANSSKNRMTSGTLATSCGPSIFPYLPASNANAIVKFLVDHCTEIFTE